jgi:hypothetical protein
MVCPLLRKGMSPYRRAALFLIRLIATGFILFPLLEVAAYLAAFLNTGKRTDITFRTILWPAISLLVGVVILIKSSSLAKRLTRDFEDE